MTTETASAAPELIRGFRMTFIEYNNQPVKSIDTAFITQCADYLQYTGRDVIRNHDLYNLCMKRIQTPSSESNLDTFIVDIVEKTEITEIMESLLIIREILQAYNIYSNTQETSDRNSSFDASYYRPLSATQLLAIKAVMDNLDDGNITTAFHEFINCVGDGQGKENRNIVSYNEYAIYVVTINYYLRMLRIL